MTLRSVGALPRILTAALGAVLTALLLVGGVGGGLPGALHGASTSGGAAPARAARGSVAPLASTVAPMRAGGRITARTPASERQGEFRHRVDTATSAEAMRPSTDSALLGPQVVATLPGRRGPPAMIPFGVVATAAVSLPVSALLLPGTARAPPASA